MNLQSHLDAVTPASGQAETCVLHNSVPQSHITKLPYGLGAIMQMCIKLKESILDGRTYLIKNLIIRIDDLTTD